MRRPPHGGTCKPGLGRPGGGFGRAVGRPGPRVPVVALPPLEPCQFVDALAAPGGDLGTTVTAEPAAR
jgi:hypothetical protein